jgi:hypothetical protein
MAQSSLSMHDATVTVFARFLKNLSAIISYAETQAPKQDLAETHLVEARLAPGMFTFAEQIRQATHHATHSIAALKETAPPALPTNFSSFAGLNERIKAAIDYLEAVSASDVDGTEQKDVSYTVAGEPRPFKGQDLLLYLCLPNFFFHVTTAYDLLRHHGIELSKRHFMGMAKPGE